MIGSKKGDAGIHHLGGILTPLHENTPRATSTPRNSSIHQFKRISMPLFESTCSISSCPEAASARPCPHWTSASIAVPFAKLCLVQGFGKSYTWVHAQLVARLRSSFLAPCALRQNSVVTILSSSRRKAVSPSLFSPDQGSKIGSSILLKLHYGFPWSK
eukprot:TRINITY_DN10732_c0_g1_i6.p1 TRINITY_DN10732_c0_g1~~TRINITY_DN10732_c0_g1_i6.p1  ORF type:complete len:159 (-),score=1.53 TRINITY_DN10732_c0_g1_i6:66-542(-)